MPAAFSILRAVICFFRIGVFHITQCPLDTVYIGSDTFVALAAYRCGRWPLDSSPLPTVLAQSLLTAVR